MQLKVNELIAAHQGAHNSLIAIEQLSESELRTLQNRFLRLAEVSHGGVATSVATVQPETDADTTPVPTPIESPDGNGPLPRVNTMSRGLTQE